MPDQEYIEVARAAVYKNGRLAAHLERVGEVVAFRYTEDWIRDDGPPVATTLPVREEVVTTAGGAVPAFFAGLLPEGRRLSALRRTVKTSADDELSLLLAVGSDTVGDVTVLPDGSEPRRAGARLREGNLTGRSYVELGQSLGLNEASARRTVSRVAEVVATWLPDLDELPFDQGRLSKLRRVIARRRDLLLD